MKTVLLFACAGIICLCSCQRKKESKNEPVSTLTHSGSVPLVDDGPPLSQIARILPIGRDSIVVMDRSFQLQLFVNYRFEKVLGKKGKGPGEYSSVTDLKANGDTLFLFDRRLGKIIGYSLKTNDVFKEVVNTDLSRFSGFIRENGAFYFAFSRYEKETALEHSLLYRLDEHNNLRELGFHYSDLGSDKIVFAITPWVPVPMRAKDNLIYFRLPFSKRMWIYDVIKNKVESFKLDLDYPENTEDLASLRSLQDQIKILEQVEMVADFFMLKDRIVLWTAKWKMGGKPPEDCKLRFYTYAGIELAHFSVSPFVWHIEDSVFARWEVDTTQSEVQYPYRITWEKYKIASSNRSAF